MMRWRGGGRPGVPAPETIHGTWWRASHPDDRFPGVIHLEPGEGAALTVNGGSVTDLGPGPTQPEDDAVFGVTTGGEEFTLVHLSGRSWDGTETVREERTRFDTVIRGAHLSDLVAPHFTGATLSTDLLKSWASGPEVKGTSGQGVPFGKAVVFPENVPQDGHIAMVGHAEVRLHWNTHAESPNRQIGTVGVYPEWLVWLDEPTGLDRLFRKSILPLLHLVGFAVRGRDTITRLVLHLEARNRVEVISTRWPTTITETNRVWAPDLLLPYATVRDRFADLMPRWFALHDRRMARLAISILGKSTDPDSPQDQFLAVMRAIEQWYLEFYGDGVRPVDKARYKSNLQTIEDVVDPDVWEVIKDRIGHANRPSLQMQMHQLCDDAGWPIGVWALSAPQFIRRCVRHRDGLTHGFKTAPPLDLDSLWWASETLEAILVQLTLIQLGFAADNADDSGESAGEVVAESWHGQFLMSSARNPLEQQAKLDRKAGSGP